MARLGLADQQDLLRWGDSLDARGELPRLVRRLVLETARGLTDLSFAAGEGTSIGGWDGVVRSADATAFVPAGLSGWEVSVDRKTAKKPDIDYAKRTATPDGSPTNECTYVALLLRRWAKRKEWAAERSKDGRWKSVQALGLDDIEAWLDSAPVSHAWISEHCGLGPHGLQTVEKWWSNWSSATKPTLPVELILAGREKEVDTLRSRLAASPQITTINASSRDEALAFLAAFENREDQAGQGTLMARTAIVDELPTWRSLHLRTSPLVLVAKTEAIATEAGGPSVHHIIVPVVRAESADIDLPAIDSHAASQLLKRAFSEGREQDADDLARLARISLLAARRRIAIKPELLRPTWARQPIPRAIRRLLLAHRWNEGNEADKALIARLIGEPYADVLEDIAKYTTGDDPLLTRVDATVTVVSSYDAWLLLRGDLHTEDLSQFSELASEVLGLTNPALELPPDERWLAGVRGKSRPHSRDLRIGVASSLALLGALGDQPVSATSKTGADWAGQIVWQQLKTANDDDSASLWASLDDVLPSLAEAAPDEFLSAVTKGLQGDPPLLRKLFIDSTDSGFFLHPTHTGLLWALEACAWSPQHFGQAVDLLARLAEIDPGGHFSNRPFNSLRTIFCPWYPQNAVDNKRRLDVLDGLRRRHSSVAWRLMVASLPHGMDTSHPTFAPHYRQWKPAKPSVTMREYWEFVEALVDRLVSDADGDASRWPELVEKLDDILPGMRTRWLDRLREIGADSTFSDSDRGRIWEALHNLVARHREFKDAKWSLPAAEIDRIAEVANLFEPTPPQLRHAWLFADQMPSIDGVHRHPGFAEYEAALMKLRVEAITEIAASSSWDELAAFGRDAKVPFAVGLALSEASLDRYEPQIIALVNSDERSEQELARAYCVAQTLKDPGWIHAALASTAMPPRHHARLLLCAPDRPKAWAAADAAGPDVAKEYWLAFPAYPITDVAELATAIERLLDVGRTGVALDLLALCLPEEDNERLVDLIEKGLDQFLTHEDQDNQVRPADYDFERLFVYLDRSASADPARIARLEWSYLAALEHTNRKFQLHQAMAEAPDLFIQLLTQTYRPHESEDESQGPERQTRERPDEATVRVAHNAWRLLDGWKVIPGTQSDGHIDPDKLRAWVTTARQQVVGLRRREVGDIHIGQVLATSPLDPDGSWPVVAIRDLIEEVRSSELDNGFRTGIVNSRGTTSRGLEDGGAQERQQAELYKQYADKLGDIWPRTAHVLRSVADEYVRDARREDEDAERFKKGLEGSGGGPLAKT